ncbi:M28 family peptidase [Ekhidna sp.]|uniref:M28 family peptidase n=1 Tax=Ekhidna sp. TaxID=2608089 RepID=UPI0032973426
MKRILSILFLLPVLTIAQDHSEQITQIYDEALTKGRVYEDLRVLCKEIGNRLSGSPEAAAAVEYTKQLMESYGFDTVYLQPVMVPHWVRGKKEVVRAINSDKHGTYEMNALALGNSVGTGSEGVLAEVIEVSGIDEVNELGKKVEGKIVFYNGQMDPTIINTFGAYGGAVAQRSSGASEAAKYGAKAIIIRSVTNRQDDIPHTGSLRYKALINQIPAVAISTNDADQLSRVLKEQTLNVYIETHCKQLPDVLSYNVIGELRGSEFPDEIIAVGGHLDSWDVGEGAHDDGSGCIQAIEAVRLFKALGIGPKRTLRAVMWMNEENGLRGGREYARVAKEKGEKHIAAIESDAGGFQPLGFSTSGTDEQRAQIKQWKNYFLPYRVWDFDQNGGGADIGPLRSQGTLLIGLRPSTQKYFIYHHTPADVFEAVDQRELELGAASMSAMMYLLDREGLK